MLSTEAPTAYVCKSAESCGKARKALSTEDQERGSALDGSNWLNLEQDPRDPESQGPQRITNILSTPPHTENVSKNADRGTKLVEKTYKNLSDRAIKN